MSKIKINKFAGITTNINEKQVGLNSLKNGRNFKVYPTYIKSDIHSYVERENLPTLLSGWTWETGIETVIVNDPHAINPIISQTIVEILIAKKVSSGVNYRQIYFKEKASTSWKVLQYDGKNGEDYASNTSKLSTVLLTSDFLNTSISGDVKFINDYGVLKIYFPHDCFWFGKLDRKLILGDNSFVVINNYYFDRLSEPVNGINLSSFAIDGVNDLLISNRRLGIQSEITKEEIILGTSINLQGYAISIEKSESIITLDNSSYQTIVKAVAFKDPNNQYIKCREIQFPYHDVENGTADTILGYINYTGYSFLFLQEFNSITHLPTGKYVIPQDMLDVENGVTISPLGTIVTTKQTACISANSLWISSPVYVIDEKEISDLKWNITGTPFTNFDSDKIWNTNLEYVEAEFVITGVLDKITEIIISTNSIYLPFGDSDEHNYTFKCKLRLPNNINRRITNINVYLKFNTDLDYQLFQEINVNESFFTEFSLTKNSFTGIYLSQKIGFKFETKKAEEYKVITAFRDIAIENRISLALTNYDYVNVYSCVVGGGNIQTDLFYPQNAINLSGISFAKGVIGINGRFLVATKTQCQIIAYREFNGTLLFESIETINVGIEMPSAMLKIENGVLLLNRLGLFYTDGYKKNKLSEPINNIIENTYSDSKIYYNDILNEVYYVMLNNYLDNNKVLRYNIERGSWEIFNIVSLTNLRNLIITQEGKVNPIFLDSIYEEFSENFYNSELEFNKSSIGEINKVFWLNGIAIDYIGSNNTISFTMEIEYYQSNSPVDNSYNKSSKIISYTLPNTTERKTVYLPVRLDSRVPFNIIIPKLVSGNNYTIYEIEYDIETNEEELFT